MFTFVAPLTTPHFHSRDILIFVRSVLSHPEAKIKLEIFKIYSSDMDDTSQVVPASPIVTKETIPLISKQRRRSFWTGCDAMR